MTGKVSPRNGKVTVDIITQSLSDRAPQELNDRLARCIRELSFYTQALEELRRSRGNDEAFMAAVLLHNAIYETVEKRFESYTEKKYLVWQIYEILFVFVENIITIELLHLLLHQMGVTVVNRHGESPLVEIEHQMMFFPDDEFLDDDFDDDEFDDE